MQLTVAVLKPDLAHSARLAAVHPSTHPPQHSLIVLLQAVTQRITASGFHILRKQNLLWSRSDAERFYAEHKGV